MAVPGVLCVLGSVICVDALYLQVLPPYEPLPYEPPYEPPPYKPPYQPPSDTELSPSAALQASQQAGLVLAPSVVWLSIASCLVRCPAPARSHYTTPAYTAISSG